MNILPDIWECPKSIHTLTCWLCALYMYNSLYGTDHHKHVPSVGVGVSSIIMNIIMVRQLYNYLTAGYALLIWSAMGPIHFDGYVIYTCATPYIVPMGSIHCITLTAGYALYTCTTPYMECQWIHIQCQSGCVINNHEYLMR